MEIFGPLLISSISGLATILGSFIVFYKPKNINKFLVFCLSFSAMIMLGLSIIELFSDSFITLTNKYNLLFSIIVSFLIFIGAIVLIRLIDKINNDKNSLYKIGLLNMIVLILHNFPEGITCFLTSYTDINLGIKISIAIMLHNIPEGIAIAAPIYYSTNSKLKALKATFIAGISEPLGAILAFLILRNFISNTLIAFLMLFVSAIMITLSVENILPEASMLKEKKSLLNGLKLGLLLVILLKFIL